MLSEIEWNCILFVGFCREVLSCSWGASMERHVSWAKTGGTVDDLVVMFSNMSESIIIAAEPSGRERAVGERAFVGKVGIQ
jgi:hypothetical protein